VTKSVKYQIVIITYNDDNIRTNILL